MKIAFITNHYKTILFYKVSKRLEKYGHETYWISPSQVWANWLVNQGVEKKKILNITDYGHEWTKDADINFDMLQELHELERKNNWSIKNLILMDRLLSQKSEKYALNYVYVCQKYIREFLSNNEIQVVFSEQTWAIELITTQVCKLLEIKSYAPHVTRIPDGRFIFFEGHLQEKIVDIREVTEKDKAEAKEYLEYFLQNKPKPEYYYLNNKKPSFKANWFWKMIKHLKLDKIDPYDETRFPITWLLKKRTNEIINYRISSLVNIFEKPSFPSKRPFILYTLHKQPEASIDVLGAYYSNQLEFIRTLSRLTPVNYEIYVKEHSNALGDRGISYYKELKKIPGVVLVDPFFDTNTLVKNSELVISISGTVVYEAAIMGKKSISASDMFFGEILIVNDFSFYKNSSFKEFNNILEKKSLYSKNKIINFIAHIIANSFEGLISDPISNPTCLAEENLDNLTTGFKELLNFCED